MRGAMDLLLPKLAKVIWNLAKFAMEWKGEPTLAYTHLQPGSYSRVLSKDSVEKHLLTSDFQQRN